LAAMGGVSSDPVEARFTSVVEELLKEGVPVNLSDSSGKSLLVYAIQSDSPMMVQTVLKHNPDLSYRQSPFGPTALHYALSGANPIIIRMLVSAGADINAITRNAEYRPAPFETSSTQANRYKKPGEYNLKIEVYSDKKNPAQDRRCFYKVFIKKVESGRTVTGLESQKKSFTTSIDINRHHISVVKYVLDERQGKYIKLNNIHQPRPSAFYTDTVEGRIRVVSIIHNEETETSYYEDYEKE
ncbi:MAG TPA: ankyrin repeat domain-containing protein, partial [Spirochaetota bacterium]|nr:ankyrin repeat domain-containing protein [Spirochaetota bacterium]